jgi:ABC-type multidrug transport system fused ATPase/permease subunit
MGPDEHKEPTKHKEPTTHKVSWQKAKRILRYLGPYWWTELEILVCMCIAVALTLIDPLVIKALIDNVFIEKNYGLLKIIMIVLLGLYVVRGLFNMITAYLYNFAGQRIIFDIRSQLFQHLEKLHMGFYSQTRIGEIIARVNDDVASLQEIVTTAFVNLITDLLTVIAILAVLIYLDWKLTLVSLTVFPLFFFSIGYFSKRIRKRSKEVREKVADILSFFQETISGMKLIQSFVREKHEARRFLRKGKEMINLRINLALLGSFANAAAGFIVALGPALVLWYGGYRVMSGVLTIGGLVAFYTYVGHLFDPIVRLAQLNITMQTALASTDRIFEFLDIEPEIRDAPDAISLKKVRGDVSFEHISFSYRPGEPILDDISFEVKRGERLAIVGPSGVGKTTIINLLCRFYDPSKGTVKLDGADIRKIKLSSLRRQIGIVSQETFLFNSSIKENLRYGDLRSTDEEIMAAVEKANIHDFMAGLPEGYETLVGDRGMRLSGGERQRLSIARAILKNPKILILDEATSSLDSISENLIQKALQPLMRDRTTITIAHRLSTVIDSDRILVLSDGRIVERGSHWELLRKDHVYKMLWDEQMKKEETLETAGEFGVGA